MSSEHPDRSASLRAVASVSRGGRCHLTLGDAALRVTIRVHRHPAQSPSTRLAGNPRQVPRTLILAWATPSRHCRERCRPRDADRIQSTVRCRSLLSAYSHSYRDPGLLESPTSAHYKKEAPVRRGRQEEHLTPGSSRPRPGASSRYRSVRRLRVFRKVRQACAARATSAPRKQGRVALWSASR